MTTLANIVVLLLIAGAIGYLLLEKRPAYGAYYGLAKLMGARLDIGPIDWARLKRRATANDTLVCTPALCPNAAPDEEPKTYSMTPAELLTRLKTIALAEPNITELSCDPNCDRSARFIQYTRVMRFPDTVDVEVFPAGAGSTLAIYSRSLLGRKDFGVNRARIRRWLGALG
jgi:uncharacterized protein (DUF1499 family)